MIYIPMGEIVLTEREKDEKRLDVLESHIAEDQHRLDRIDMGLVNTFPEECEALRECIKEWTTEADAIRAKYQPAKET